MTEHKPDEVEEVVDDPNSPDDVMPDQTPYPDVEDIEPDDDEDDEFEVLDDDDVNEDHS